MDYKVNWKQFRKLHATSIGATLIEIAGDCRLLMERHLGVLEYDSENICVGTTFGSVVVSGCKLELMQMTNTMLVITGKITSVVMQRR